MDDGAVPFTKIKCQVLSAALEALSNFAARNTEGAEQTTLILTGDFGLTRETCSATVQKFQTSSWRDWQIWATIHELPGDLIFVKNCVTKELDVTLGSSYEPATNRTRDDHDAVGAIVKMRLPFVVLNERTAPQKTAELRGELKARVRAAEAENAERLPKNPKTAAADGSHPVAQQSIAPKKPPVETAAAAGPQPVAQKTIAPGVLEVDLSESECWDTAAVEEHAEGGQVEDEACGSDSGRSKSKRRRTAAAGASQPAGDAPSSKRRRTAAAGASQLAGDAPSGQTAAVAKARSEVVKSRKRLLKKWFKQEFGPNSRNFRKKVHDVLFQKARYTVPEDLWENKNQPETVMCLASETHTLESIQAVLEERREWMQAKGHPPDQVMTQDQRQAYVAAKKKEFDDDSLQRGLAARDLREWNNRNLEKKKLTNRKHSRFHRMMQLKVGSKQNWELISYTGTLDIDALRAVAAEPGGAPEPAEDAATRREARKNAIEARRWYCWGKTLWKRERSGERLSREEWKTLLWYNDDSLRRWANDLTEKSGNGTIYNRDGTTTMLGGNMSRSITQRVLDRFQPSMRPEELDLTQYH